MEWYRNDKGAVVEALRRGERPDLATTMASGSLDELVALQQELGIFAILDELEVQRARAGVPDELLLHTLATLPFVEQASLSGATEVLFREPAVLVQLGWAPVQIRSGSNGRHRHPNGLQEESLPCHPDTLRDALRRVGESAWLRAQVAGTQALYQRQLVRGKVYAVDGSGLGEDMRLVALVCVSATRPIIVAWRLLSGSASEKGQEAVVTRSLIEQVLQELAQEKPRALVSNRTFSDDFAALQAFRPRWHIEDDTFRELKEGWGLEQQHRGRDFAAALGRMTLTCLAFNTAQVYRLQTGERLALVAIRLLRRYRQRELGSAPAVIYLAGCYGVFALEELLSLLGTPAHESLLPDLHQPSSQDAPT
jgi:hypothetical protein